MVTLLYIPSSSSLLHASLAHLTPELTAVDNIIQCSGRRSRLPTELMLIVRTHLVSGLSASLAEESNDALAAYSRSLISLLCSDCTSYNTDIYGGNVFDWPWDQFSGPCLCSGDIDDCIARTQAFTDSIAKLQCDPAVTPNLFSHMQLLGRNRTAAEEDNMSFTRGLLLFNPRLLDPEFFLELYLSRQARRFARLAYKEGLKAVNRGDISETRRRSLFKIRSVWDAVERVLGEHYGCEVIPRQRASASTHEVSVTANPPFTTVTRPVEPSSKTTMAHSKPPIEASNTSQIVELDAKDLETLPAASASPVPSMPFFPSGLMSTTYRREQDPIYISFIPKQADNGTSDVQGSAGTRAHNPWATGAALLRVKRFLGFSPPTTPSDSFAPESSPPSDDHPASCNVNEVGRPSIPPSPRLGSPTNPLDIRVADSTPNYRHRCLSVPSPATKHLPVPSELTTGITSSPATTGITEALRPVDSDVQSNLH